MEMCTYPETLSMEDLFLFPEYESDPASLEVVTFIPPRGYFREEPERQKRAPGEPGGKHLAGRAYGGKHVARPSVRASVKSPSFERVGEGVSEGFGKLKDSAGRTFSKLSAEAAAAGNTIKQKAPGAVRTVSNTVQEKARSVSAKVTQKLPHAETAAPAASSPKNELRTKRGVVKTALLNVLTLGLYGLMQMCHISGEINEVASRHDGKHTMNYFVAFFLLGGITLGILPLVWTHKLCARIGDELSYRGIDYRFGAGTFWGWGVFGCLVLVGPVIYRHKFLKAMNLINSSYNKVG